MKPRVSEICVKQGVGVFLLYFDDSMLRCKTDSSLNKIINFLTFILAIFLSVNLGFLF